MPFSVRPACSAVKVSKQTNYRQMAMAKRTSSFSERVKKSVRESVIQNDRKKTRQSYVTLSNSAE